MATAPDTPITLDMLGALLRQVQADQRNIRTQQETMRGLLAQLVTHQAVSVFQTALLKRLGETEALSETRFDRLEALVESRFDGIIALLGAPRVGG